VRQRLLGVDRGGFELDRALAQHRRQGRRPQQRRQVDPGTDLRPAAEVVEGPLLARVAVGPTLGSEAVGVVVALAVAVQERVRDQHLGPGGNPLPSPVRLGESHTRQHRGGRIQAHRLLQASAQVRQLVVVAAELRLGLCALAGVRGDQGQGPQRVERQGVARGEEPVRDLPHRRGLVIGRRLAKQAGQAPLLGRRDVLDQARDEARVALRRLARHPVGLRHHLAERPRQLLIVAGRVAEHHPAGQPAKREAPLLPPELAVRELGQHRLHLFFRHGCKPRGEPVSPAAVEHRLVEVTALSPQAGAGDGHGVGLKGDHPVALGFGVGRERVGRALEGPVHVGGSEQQQRPIAHHPHPHGATGMAAPHPLEKAHRPAVDVGPGRRRDGRGAAAEDPLHCVGDDDERVEARVLEQRGRADAAHASLRQGANAFSHPSSAGPSSG
jgi:hypothetical protein